MPGNIIKISTETLVQNIITVKQIIKNVSLKFSKT